MKTGLNFYPFDEVSPKKVTSHSFLRRAIFAAGHGIQQAIEKGLTARRRNGVFGAAFIHQYRFLRRIQNDVAVMAGAQVFFGVGTQLSTSYDAPTLGGVYKLVEEEVDGRTLYKIKLSTEKATYPGRKQVWRRTDAEGRFLSDVITLADEPPPPDAFPLLEEIMRGGRLVTSLPTLEEIRERTVENVRRLPEAYRRLRDAAEYPVSRSERLEELRQQVIAELQGV